MECGGNTGSCGPVDLGGLSRRFGPGLLDSDACRKVVFENLHPAGGKCPSCGQGIGEGLKAERFMTGGRVVCSSCGKRFSAVTGTILAGSHLDPREVVLLIFMLVEGIRVGRISEILNLDRSTVRTWKEKIIGMVP